MSEPNTANETMQKKNRTKYNYRKDPENLKQIQI